MSLSSLPPEIYRWNESQFADNPPSCIRFHAVIELPDSKTPAQSKAFEEFFFNC